MVDFIAGKLSPSFPRRRESPNINDTLKEPTIMSHIAGDSRLRGNDGESNGNDEKGDKNNDKPKPLEFSEQATDLFTCGKKLWQYYHQEARNDENYLNDASFYDIRRYFQGVNDKEHSRGLSTANPLFADLSHNAKTRMNNKSSDAKYNKLLADLRKTLKKLGEERIVEKVFEYGFLLK